MDADRMRTTQNRNPQIISGEKNHLRRVCFVISFSKNVFFYHSIAAEPQGPSPPVLDEPSSSSGVVR